jgi:hypothetical protein
MDVFKIIDAVGAEIACNQAIARVGDARVIIARIVGSEMVLTAEGEELAKTLETEKPKELPPRKRARNTDGTLKGDDPKTPDVNEAWANGDS